MKNLKQIQQKHGISNDEIATMLGYKNRKSFRASSAYNRFITALEKFYNAVKK
jgi:hypothetical protein